MMEPTEIVYAAVTGIAVLALILGRSKAQYAHGAKMALWWIVILGLTFSVVVYWPEVQNSKLYTSLVGGSAKVHEDGSMEFTRGDDGHFHINAKVNGVSVEFMVDTGAADIVLTKKDAERAGFYANELEFNKLYTTANGKTRGASVKLKNLEVGNYQTGEIYASVNEGELDTSLLGMRFLDKMRQFRIEGDRLVIQP